MRSKYADEKRLNKRGTTDEQKILFNIYFDVGVLG
jgi:hypothetical protein